MTVLTLVSLACLCLTATNAAAACPANAHDPEGKGCVCKPGFAPSADGQRCEVVNCPQNAHANPSTGPTCLCNKGFQPSSDGGSCQAISCPVNSKTNPDPKGPKCVCNFGYHLAEDGSSQCVVDKAPQARAQAKAAAVSCPVHSHTNPLNTGSKCICDDGYVPTTDGRGCTQFQCPVNSHPSKNSAEKSPCTCDDGYQPSKSGAECIFAIGAIGASGASGEDDKSGKGKVKLSADPIKVNVKRRVSLATDSSGVVGAAIVVPREYAGSWDYEKTLTALPILLFVFGGLWGFMRYATQKSESGGMRWSMRNAKHRREGNEYEAGIMIDAAFGGAGLGGQRARPPKKRNPRKKNDKAPPWKEGTNRMLHKPYIRGMAGKRKS